MLGPGNLGALRQFSHKDCRPQFCHVTDLGKTVTVEHKGKAVQRTLAAQCQLHPLCKAAEAGTAAAAGDTEIRGRVSEPPPYAHTSFCTTAVRPKPLP